MNVGKNTTLSNGDMSKKPTISHATRVRGTCSTPRRFGWRVEDGEE